MPKPNMFIVYVSDAAASARFYSELFEMEPSFESPAFIAFDLAQDVQLALWSRGTGDFAAGRTSEVSLNLAGGPERIDEQYRRWAQKGVTVIQAPHDDVFGRTFLIADPDGNLIRVAPLD
ncbi:VOC family protein [Mycobacterium sp. SMC-4]|uniref:VOC family protein n=1 Tax=Mycobacterium sp. SMC-4 TaxID=2857059 RepID=UPI003D08007F